MVDVPIPGMRPAAPAYQNHNIWQQGTASRTSLPHDMKNMRRISLDFNSHPDITVPGVEIIVPFDASEKELEAAAAYVQGTKALFEKYGYKSASGDESYAVRPYGYRPGVKRKKKNGVGESDRGVPNTFHLEPFFVQDEQARRIYMDPNFQNDYAEMLNKTIRQIPNAVTIAPHEGPGADTGAKFIHEGERITEYHSGLGMLPKIAASLSAQNHLAPLTLSTDETGAFATLGLGEDVAFADPAPLGYRDLPPDDWESSMNASLLARMGQLENEAARDMMIERKLGQVKQMVAAYAETHGYDWTDEQLEAMASFHINTGQLDDLTAGGTLEMPKITEAITDYKDTIEGEGQASLRRAERNVLMGKATNEDRGMVRASFESYSPASMTKPRGGLFISSA